MRSPKHFYIFKDFGFISTGRKKDVKKVDDEAV